MAEKTPAKIAGVFTFFGMTAFMWAVESVNMTEGTDQVSQRNGYDT